MQVAPNAASAPTAIELAPVKVRRPWQQNWESAEILALIRTKAIEHQASHSVVDAHFQMETAQQNWMRISRAVMAKRVSPHERDDSACIRSGIHCTEISKK